MTFEWDRDADDVYITLRTDVPFKKTILMDDARMVDFGKGTVPIGIELLDVSDGVDVRGLPEEEAVAQLLRAHGIRITHASVEVA